MFAWDVVVVQLSVVCVRPWTGIGTVVVSLLPAFFVLMQFIWTTEERARFVWWGNHDEGYDIFAGRLIGRREVGTNSRAISYSIFFSAWCLKVYTS